MSGGGEGVLHILDAAIWWTGVCVLSAGALLAAAAVVTGISIVAILLGNHHARRLGNVAQNMLWLHEWVRAGKPVWTNVGKDGEHVMAMVPTVPVADEGDEA